MTTTTQPTRSKTTTAKRVPMNPLRKTALVAGVLYLITFISIPTLVLYGPVLGDPLPSSHLVRASRMMTSPNSNSSPKS